MRDDSLITPVSMSVFTSMMDRYFSKKIEEKVGSCRPKDAKTLVPIPKVYKYPFLDITVREQIVCSQYRYLTILTDGGINPDVNGSFACPINRYPLSIDFDDGDLWRIRSEAYNINIEKYGVLYFNNLIHDCIVGADPENGYGNLYLFLSMEKLDKMTLKKHNPHACVTGTLAPSGTIEYWLGTDKINPGYISILPFVPWGYEILAVCGAVPEITINMRGYCCRGTSFCQQQNVTTTNCTHINNCCNRWRLLLTNTDTENPQNYCVNMTFLNKSDGNF